MMNIKNYILIIACFATFSLMGQNVGIGTMSPDPSALLHLNSTNSGLLLPKLTNIQMNAINIPADGLLVFNTDENAFFYFHTGNWHKISPNSQTFSNGLKFLQDTIRFGGRLENPTILHQDNKSFAIKDLNGNQSTYISQSIFNLSSGLSNTPLTQSIQFSEDLSLHSINLRLSTLAGRTITASIKDESNNLLTSKAIHFNSILDGWVNFEFPDTIVFEKSKIYLISVITDLIGADWHYSNANPYPSGVANSNVMNDFAFVIIRRDEINVLNIKSNKVGIGVNNPQAQLHVQGNVKIEDGTEGLNKVLTSDASGNATWENTSNSAWSKTGNGGTNSNIHFIGTTDNNPLIFKFNNQYAGKVGISSTFFGSEAGNLGNIYAGGVRSVGIGSKALSSLGSGDENVAVGYQAMWKNEYGSSNTAIGLGTLQASIDGFGNVVVGARSMLQNTNGHKNVSIGFETMYSSQGSENIAIGYEALRQSNGNTNIAIGVGAGRNILLQSKLIAIGDSSLFNNTDGRYNTAIGSRSLFTNTNGEYNTAVGYLTLFNNTSGNHNSAFGNRALISNNAGEGNTAVGSAVLFRNISGSNNTAIGISALSNNTIGEGNTACGAFSLLLNTSGIQNTAIERFSLNHNNGDFNTASGHSALAQNTSGNRNSAFGSSALSGNVTGQFNTACGVGSLYSNINGNNNCAFGESALYLNLASNNTAIGFQSLYSNSSGPLNTAIGSLALESNDSGNSNVAAGYNALNANTSGSSNTACGTNALTSNLTASNNSAFGKESLLNNTTGNSNVSIGVQSFSSNTTGSGNTTLGYQSGRFSGTNSTDCTLIGRSSNTLANTSYTNSTAVGYLSTVTASNQMRFGNTSISSIGGYVGWSNISDARFKNNIQADIPGLKFILKLVPVSYNIDKNGLSRFLGENELLSSDENDVKSNSVHNKYSGFLAQDVEQIAKSIGYDFSGVDIPENSNGLYGLRYAEFVVPLVQAMKEQQAMIESLIKEKEIQNEKIENLQGKLENLVDILAKMNSNKL